MDDKMQRELMSKLAELESKHKRRLPQDRSGTKMNQ